MPRVVSFIVLVSFLLIIGAIFFKVMANFVLPLFLAAVLVVVFKPLHMWVREQLPGRLRLSALVTTLIIMLIVMLPTSWLAWNAYHEGKTVLNFLRNKENQNKLVAKLEHAAGPILELYDGLGSEQLPPTPEGSSSVATPTPTPDGSSAPADAIATPPSNTPPARQAAPVLRTLFSNTATAIRGFLFDIAQDLLWLFVGLIIMVLALYYFLLDGPTMIHSMMQLSPLDNEYERQLLDKFANVSRAVVVAVLAAAAAQGLLAGIGFYFALEPGAPVFLLTAMTMIGAVVPFVGAAGVWIPTCLWIYFYQEHVVNGVVEQGDTFTAVVLAIYCGCIVSTIDNVIKPLVLHGQSNIHPLLALMSVLGGIKALGPAGILVGPMVVAFIHALLVMVNRELRLMGSEKGDGLYQRSMFPLDPAFESEAAQLAHESPGGALEDLEAAARSVTGPDPGRRGGPPSPPAKRPGPIARVQNAAKRRRRRK